jgi:hypothetical protein
VTAPLPLDDPCLAQFWREARHERLALQRCARCSYVRWPPAAICPECWSPDCAWAELSREGTVWSFAVYERAFSPEFEAAVPYIVALVRLAAGPAMISTIAGVAPEEMTVGMRVVATFEPVDEVSARVTFTALDQGASA